ncbi:MAG: DUF1249 domain-containing protein [Xanthomonadales bacterium PRO6]|nr:DUF1249 domain-containing protein [Xanthomonadales bacterium PRO6]
MAPGADSVATPGPMNTRIALPNAFEWLLGLYGDNFERLQRLVDARRLVPGRYLNESPGQPALVLDVLEQQPYTTLLRLSLRFVESAPEEDPESYWRVYHDARQAEVTHCRFDSHRVRLFAPNTPARQIAQYRRRMNSFANKWLEHLLQGGYDPQRWVLQGPVPEWDRRLVVAPGAGDEAEERPARRGARRTLSSV